MPLPPYRETSRTYGIDFEAIADRIADRVVADLPWAGLRMLTVAGTDECRARLRDLVLEVLETA